jgi:hypothetical protein
MEIIALLLGLSSAVFLTAYLREIGRSTNFAEEISVLKTEITILEGIIRANPSDKDIVSEDFIKFLSDSRTWAFDYIKTFQDALEEFVKDAGPSIDGFDTYGDAVFSPFGEYLKRISASYKELIKVLPDKTA